MNLFYEQIQFLAENRSIDVIICVIPDEMFISLTKREKHSTEDTGKVELYLEHDFRRLLKAKCMHLGVPLQLVVESTLLTGKANRGNQDDATRAWNFATALYYKGNKTVPWRLKEERFKPKSCYVGIGFYRSRDGETISTSLAQVFDEFGHGVILRGTPVVIDKNDNKFV